MIPWLAGEEKWMIPGNIYLANNDKRKEMNWNGWESASFITVKQMEQEMKVCPQFILDWIKIAKEDWKEKCQRISSPSGCLRQQDSPIFSLLCFQFADVQQETRDF